MRDYIEVSLRVLSPQIPALIGYASAKCVVHPRIVPVSNVIYRRIFTLGCPGQGCP